MKEDILSGRWSSSSIEPAVRDTSVLNKRGRSWRESLQRINETSPGDSHLGLTAAGDSAGGSRGSTWRSSVLAQSSLVRDTGTPPAADIQPASARNISQDGLTPGGDGAASSELAGAVAASPGAISAPRLSSNNAAPPQEPVVCLSPLPQQQSEAQLQPQPFRQSAAGLQPSSAPIPLQAAGHRQPGAAHPDPDAPISSTPPLRESASPIAANAAQDGRISPLQRGERWDSGNGGLQPGLMAGAAAAAAAGAAASGGSAPGSGWRSSLAGLLAQSGGERHSGSGTATGTSSLPGAMEAAPAVSSWRTLTQSFANRSAAGQDGVVAGAGASDSTGPSARVSFRSPASLALHAASDSALPSRSRQSSGGGTRARTSRVLEAAERAVQEHDAEVAAAAAAGDAGAASDGGDRREYRRSSSSGRRLRFSSGQLESAQSSIGKADSRGNSRHQSFGNRLANVLGSFLGRSRSVDSSQSEDVSPMGTRSLRRLQSALKKEGTSKQLRLGFSADVSDGSDGDDAYHTTALGSGYRKAKLEGAVAGAMVLRLPTGDASGAAATSDVAAAAAPPPPAQAASLPQRGVGRLDSVVVPARLHVNVHSLSQAPQDLEATLMTPSELLPPGESLPLPFRRPGGLLMRAGARTGAAPRGPEDLPAPETPTISRSAAQTGVAQADGDSTAAPAVGGLGLSVRATGGAAAVRWGVESEAAAVAEPGTARSVSAAPSVAASATAQPAPSVAAGSSAPSRARSTIKLPIITTGHWDSLVFATVWRVGRVFGFQAFNVRPATQDDPKREYVPASIFVAADHLIQLLVKNGYVRRHKGDDMDDERFAKALFEFHSTIFYSYEMQWTKMQRLSPRVQRFTDQLREQVFSDHYVINGLLCELALYFLIYTESANLRFCPEALWMLFWCMNHSYVMVDLWSNGSPNRVPSARDRLPQLRNTHQHLILELQALIHVRPQDMRPEDCGKMSSILTRLAATDVPPSDRELLADLVSYGDGGFYLDRIVTPIFYVMSYEIDHLATLGVDTAHRLGYDDFNESLTCRDVVLGALMELRVTPQDIMEGAPNDAYHSLTSLGFQGRTIINNKFDPQAAAEWWRHRVFVKTYRERRSWWGVYRAFFRVYAFHFVLFHVLQAQAFAGWNWRIVSSGVLTHAWLTWLERLANWKMTIPVPEPLQTSMTKIFDRKGFFRMDKVAGALAPQSRRSEAVAGRNRDRLQQMKAHEARSANVLAGQVRPPSVRQLQSLQPERVLEIEGAPLFGLFGGLVEWLVFATALSAFYSFQWSGGLMGRITHAYWGYVAAGYTGAHLLHFLLTTRDGYAISLTQALRLPYYFQNFSSRPRPKSWMYLPMHINWKNFTINVFFWLIVLAMKIPFDYFVIHKPIVKPIRLLLTRNWLGCKGPVYRFPGGATLPCVGGDWILVAARVFPFIIVSLFDTALFYQFTVTMFGIYHGLIKLDLGVISSWEDLVREFHKSPPRWWLRCMSFTGNENQKNLLFSTISATAAARGAEAGAGGGGTGGAGGAGNGHVDNVAISDGLMFKIKIVTPEEIRAKQGLMLKERKINMHAGKAGPSTEVEAKGLRAVQERAAGGAGGAAGGAGAKTGSTSFNPRGGGGGSVLGSVSRTDAKDTAAASAAISAGDGTSGGLEFRPWRPRPSRGRNAAAAAARGAVPLVGQDFKDGSGGAGAGAGAGGGATSGIFSWRGQGGRSSADGVGSQQAAGGGLTTAVSMGRRGGGGSNSGSGPPAGTGGGLFGLQRNGTSIVRRDGGEGVAADGGSGGAGAGGAGAGSGGGGGGMGNIIRTFTAASLKRGSFKPKASQVHPQPVAEAVELRDAPPPPPPARGPPAADAAANSASPLLGPAPHWLGRATAAASTASPSASPPTAPSAPASCSSAPRARATLDGWSSPPSRRPHPAWQPQELLGPAHEDYNPEDDPMSRGPVSDEDSDGGGGGGEGGRRGRRHWRLWPWRKRARREDGEEVQGGAGGGGGGPWGGAPVPGPALASLRVHGWVPQRAPDTQVQPFGEQQGSSGEGEQGGGSGGGGVGSGGGSGGGGGGDSEAGGGGGGRRVYRGPLGEGLTLLGPDGRPLPDAASDDSGNSSDEDGEGGMRRMPPHLLMSEVPIIRLDSGPMNGISVFEPLQSNAADLRAESFLEPVGRPAGRVGFGPEVDEGAGLQEGGRAGRSGQLGGASSRIDSESSRRGVRFNKEEEDDKMKGLSAMTSDIDNDDVDGRSPRRSNKPQKPPRRRTGILDALFGGKSGDLDDSDDDRPTPPGAGSGNLRGADASVRAGGASRKSIDASSRRRSMDPGARRRSMDVSVRGPRGSGDPSTQGRADRSVRGGDRSVRGGGRGGPSVGPAAAGWGLNVQRSRSISAATSTNFEQKQFAKQWEEKHGVAAQVVRRDLATRTTSMVLMGTEQLHGMEEDELDVVSEQMMMWSSFAEAWDAICDDLREGDLISDKEMDLLKFVRLESSGKLHGLRPILLPTFFFAGQIRRVVDTGRVTTAQVMVLTEFRVLITWLACQVGLMSGKHAHVIMTTGLYGGIINVKHIGLRKKSFDSTIKLIGLVETAIRTREIPFDIKDFADHLVTILNGLESECYAVQKMWELGRVSGEELEDALTLFEVVQDMQDRVRSDPEGLKQCLKRAVALEDITTNTNVLLQVTTVLRQMLTTTSADATPQGEEAQRVLGFFINSLGHPSLDKPESLEFMLSWSVLTPAYDEDVLYAVDSGLAAEELGLPKKKITDLLSETDDGFSLMAYLRAMFAFEWSNFKERMRRLVGRQVDIPDWSQVTELDFGPGGLLFDFRTELQLWASFRGQLLARTVRGMMCYERALKVLCKMEYPTPMGITDEDYNRWMDAMVTSKFEYVVAVQTYGRNARSNDLRLRQLSQGVDVLVQRFPSLKVAYLDDALDTLQHGPTQFSVLIRNRRASDPIVDPTRPFGKIVEAYRIRLPYNRYSSRGVVLGEGKPENQNHASIFAFNEGLQAIDMNQDNYLAEALKMRNLLSELHPSNKGSQYLLFADDTPSQVLSPHMTAAELRFVILSRMRRAFPTAIVGFREWIFSANTGALGQYAAATEYSFATIQSRIMTKPPRVRMHYGHPDVFNKTHILTRGGMSKGTRTLHISEDYFIGAAHTLRGARIRYKEYISCGKGRDMGFDSILAYQKKISGGAADLATSREVHRLGTRLDFFRLMSFYHGGIGHFLNSYLTLSAAWYNIWALLLTALAQAMELGLRGEKGQVTLTQTYNVQQVLQLGTLAIIPYVGQLILETGLLRTCITVFGQIVTGSLFFYIFQQQTVAASISSVMAFGGMRYIGTGRGFSIQTTDFIKMYTLYARSHLYLGFEVLFFCATLYSLNDCVSCNYAALTWNSWLLAFVLLLCPLWFNPFIFNLSKVQRDFTAWKRWLLGDVDAGTGTNWFTWNREQLAKPRNDDGNVTDAWRNALREVVGTCMPYALLALAMVSRLQFRIVTGFTMDNPYLEFLAATALMWSLALGLSYMGHNLLERAKSKEWRIIRYCITLAAVCLFVVYMVVLTRFYSGNGLDHLLSVGYANLMILIMVHRAATFVFTQNNAVRDFVDSGFYLIDVLVGYAMFGILALLSFVGFVNLLQSKLLFNEAFSQSVQTARIKMQVKRSGKQIKRKSKPGLLMTMEEWMRSRPTSAASVAPSMAATVYDGGGVSRAVSLAPSAMTSFAPSAATSAAPSGFTSRAGSFSASRISGLDDATSMVAHRPVGFGARRLGSGGTAGGAGGSTDATVAGGAGAGGGSATLPPQPRPWLGTGSGMGPGPGGRSAVMAASASSQEDMLAGLQPPDSGLRERRLRFGS